MGLTESLEKTFATNFVSYYRAHVAHVNIQGRNFYSDHKFLQKIYEDLQDNIDTLAEKLRTIQEFMPDSIAQVLSLSVREDDAVAGSSDELLQLVLDDQLQLIELYRELEEAAEDEEHDEIANYAQDRLTVHERFVWQLTSILE
jgi:starvation-inducible DNA-binding protein